MFKNLLLRKTLRELMECGGEATIYADGGTSVYGVVVEVGWSWCRVMMEEDGRYSSWLVKLDSIFLLCDFSRRPGDGFSSAEEGDDLDDGQGEGVLM